MNKSKSPITTVIFDMDGVLINSEPLWKATEIEVFAELGLDFEAIGGEKTVGMRIDEVIAYWYERYPWEEKTPQEVVEQIMDKMEEHIRSKGEAMEGVSEILEYLIQQNYIIALASSSYERLITATLETLNIAHYFKATFSAEHLAFGKPHPLIYLTAAKALYVIPESCIVVEDSINGVKAGKAAGMFVAAIPDGTHNVITIPEADVQLSKLTELKAVLKKLASSDKAF